MHGCLPDSCGSIYRGAPFAAVSSPVGPRRKKKSVSPEGQDAPSVAGDEQPQDIRCFPLLSIQ